MMANRGRGRGGGGRGWFGGGRGGGYAKMESVKLFPEEVTLPEKVDVTQEEKYLIRVNLNLQSFWKSSAYYIEAPSEKGQSVDIERYSDKGKPKRHRRRDNLDTLLKISSFPTELQDVLLGRRGSKQRAPKKARTTVGKGIDKFDMLEKLEREGQNKDASEKPKKDEDEEDADEEGEDEEDGEYSDDGDYNQNEYFDDDEDDYNDATGGTDDEPEL